MYVKVVLRIVILNIKVVYIYTFLNCHIVLLTKGNMVLSRCDVQCFIMMIC